MLVVMRLIQGLGVGQLISLVPLYITEVAPPHRRGVLSGLTACGLTLGYITYVWSQVSIPESTNCGHTAPLGPDLELSFRPIQPSNGVCRLHFPACFPCYFYPVYSGFQNPLDTSVGSERAKKAGKLSGEFTMIPTIRANQQLVQSLCKLPNKSNSTER